MWQFIETWQIKQKFILINLIGFSYNVNISTITILFNNYKNKSETLDSTWTQLFRISTLFCFQDAEYIFEKLIYEFDKIIKIDHDKF